MMNMGMGMPLTRGIQGTVSTVVESITSLSSDPQSGQDVPINLQVSGACTVEWMIYPAGNADPDNTQFSAGTDGTDAAALQAGSFAASPGASTVDIDLSSGLDGSYDLAMRAVGDTNIFVASAIDLDTTGPAYVSALSIAANQITITHSETLTGTGSVGDWTVSVAGSPATVSAVSVSGAGVTLTLSASFAPADTLLVSFSDTSSDLVDSFGNAMASYTDQAVSNIFGLMEHTYVGAQGTNTPDTTSEHDFTFDITGLQGDVVVVVGYTKSTPGNTSAPEIEVNGVAATLQTYQLYTDNIIVCGIATIADPGTDSAVVTVRAGTDTFNAGRLTCAAYMIDGNGAGGSAVYSTTDTDVSMDGTANMSLSALSGDIIIGCSYENTGTASNGATWTGLIKDGFADSGPGQGEVLSVASLEASSDGAIAMVATPSVAVSRLVGAAILIKPGA